MKMSCEHAIWHILPAIRRELVRNLVREIGLSQHKTANLIGISDSAVSQYLSGKRGMLVINDQEVLDEISKTAHKIHNGGGFKHEELCRICTMMRKEMD